MRTRNLASFPCGGVPAVVPGVKESDFAPYAAAFRAGLQRHAAAKDQRIVKALSSSAEERYLEFVRDYPSIALRVPQSMLASYLGITPETVSRIRKNLSRK
jgi:CRP-like cAMP-binding protein